MVEGSLTRTRRRSWAEHPLSIPMNLCWALSIIYVLILAPIHDAPSVTWMVAVAWLVGNIIATLVIRGRLTVPVVEKTADDEVIEGTSLFRDALRRLRRNQLATLAAGLVAVLGLLCFAQRLLLRDDDAARAEPDSFYALHIDHARINKEHPSEPPSAAHWFGTDALGRDVFARTLFGGSISFTIGFVATLVSLLIGVTWGATAGYLGGRIDHYMMRVVDVLYGLPFIFLVILILTLVNGLDSTAAQNRPMVEKLWELEAGGLTADATAHRAQHGIDRSIELAVYIRDNWTNPVIVMFFALGLVQWLTMARITRGQVLSIKQRDYVVAARVVGARTPRIIFLHIVPNLLGPVIVYTTLTIPTVILAEAFLSFIGLGIPEPDCSWGTLASEGLYAINVIKPYWWMIVYPAAAISLALFSLNFIGDGLRDALDPRGKRS